MELFSCLLLLLPLLACKVQGEREPMRRSPVPVLRKPIGSAGTGCYFIVLVDKTSEEEMQRLIATVSKYAEGYRIYSTLRKVTKAFTAKLTPYALELVRRMPGVDYVEEEGLAVGTQSIPEWHLDRLDQVPPTLDHAYWPIGDGRGVDVYILDSGIHYEHEEFEFRAKYAGRDPTDDYNIANFAEDERPERQYGRDCHGHGTHVASLCGGRTYGAAKKVNLYSVRVLGCNNAGPWSVVLEGIDHVVEMVERTGRPSVLSMSFGGDRYFVVDNAITRAIDRTTGIHVVVAAGNGGNDACGKSPAANNRAITVGGTRQGDGLYRLGPGTNFGSCVDIFAPGERVLGADFVCDNCSRHFSGTSMSTPLVSGLAAILLSKQPLLTASELKERIVEMSLRNAIDYTGMPDQFKDVTPNRLATIPGSCGEKESRFGRFVISSPNFPEPYPPNLDCRWEVGGIRGIRVSIHIDVLNLEPHYDSLRVFDGCCEDMDNLQRQLTGDLRNMNFSFNSTGNLVCIQLLTDGANSASGFNGTYTKFYAGTDLVVPNPTLPPPPVANRPPTDTQVTLLMSPRQARERIRTLMATGYMLTWISSYRLGPNMNPYFDFVATNSSLVDTISHVEIGHDDLNSTIQAMEARGYYVCLLIDRIRGRNPSEPSYSVIFKPRDPIFRTQVHLRDSYQDYVARLQANTAAGYRLLSQSSCAIRGQVEVASVFVQDRRIPLGLPAPSYPTQHVRNNMTFFDFTTTTLRLASQDFFPASVEVFMQGGEPRSFFSVIYEERDQDTYGNWFRWSLNTTAARDLIARETQHSWNVYLTVGYTYLGNTEHFVEFQRKNL